MSGQEIIMALIVVAAVVYFARRIFRTAKGKSGCSSCGPKAGGCSGCSGHHESEDDKRA